MQISGQINLILYFITTFLMNLFLLATVIILSVGLGRIFINAFKTLFRTTTNREKLDTGFSMRLFSLVLTFLAGALLMDVIIDTNWGSMGQFAIVIVLKLMIDFMQRKLIRKED